MRVETYYFRRHYTYAGQTSSDTANQTGERNMKARKAGRPPLSDEGHKRQTVRMPMPLYRKVKKRCDDLGVDFADRTRQLWERDVEGVN